MFDNIFETIEEWMRGLLSGMISSNLATMFTDVNEKTEGIVLSVYITVILYHMKSIADKKHSCVCTL